MSGLRKYMVMRFALKAVSPAPARRLGMKGVSGADENEGAASVLLSAVPFMGAGANSRTSH